MVPLSQKQPAVRREKLRIMIFGMESRKKSDKKNQRPGAHDREKGSAGGLEQDTKGNR